MKKARCAQCSAELQGKYQLKFCTQSCAATFNNQRRLERSVESRRRTSQSVSRRQGIYGPYTRIYRYECLVCKRIGYKPHRAKVCSKECQNRLEAQRRTGRSNPKLKYAGKKIDRQAYHYYRTLAEFKLQPDDLPKIKNYHLLLERGMWGYKNKMGVVRDHLLSIKDGWILGITPEIISHPANCQFLPIRENSQKRDRSSITYKELLKRIRNW